MIKIKRSNSNIRNSRFRHLVQFLRLNLLNIDGVYLAGGAVRSILDNSEIKDYDLFFKDQKSMLLARGELIRLGATLVFECPNHELVTYSYKGLKIQLVTLEYYDSMESCLNSFDFSVCMMGLDKEYLYINKLGLKDIRNKRVTLISTKYPVATINRLFKYKNKGYDISKAVVDMVNMLHSMNPESELNTRQYVD